MIVDQKINKQFMGVYLVDGSIDRTLFATTIIPNLFRRVFTRLFLGWKWVSIKKLKLMEAEQEAIELALKVEQEAIELETTD